MTAPVISCKPRSAVALLEVVAMLDAEHNIAYQRRDVTGDGVPETFCNFYVHDATALLGCPIPKVRANDQVDWLEGVGVDAGWRECGALTAADKADMGLPTVACWRNPSARGHGHIALVVPRPEGRRGVYIAQAGASNFSCEPARSGFGNLPLQFFWHS